MAAILLAHIGVPCHGKDAVGVSHIELIRLVLAFGNVDRAVTDIEGADAAAGEHAEPVNKIVRYLAAGAGEVGRRGRENDTVFKVYASDLDRLKNVLIFGSHL